ncbi:conjugative transposon protein TraN [Chitinophaga sancti]|uniref:conjugative transposon protein TraN n=1 Tax=Chitinophaga sancti TaxID=1004 RepID=UPI002A74C4B0|nr:conjugative transposon protein TraN [Chitinophaga sancti]WPQ61936.1 conjugative transposon protein TraN [Chitinophaga sancti]
MKRVCVVTAAVWMMLFSFRLMAQEPMVLRHNIPDQIYVTVNKTTSILFSAAVKSVDRGSKDILLQKAKGTENVLQVKASKTGFPSTNLTVITSDGAVYAFTISYDPDPRILDIQIPADRNSSKGAVIFTAQKDNEAKFSDFAWQLVSKKSKLNRPRDAHDLVSLKLAGLYVKDDAFYFQFVLNNNSNISYDLEQFRFFIADKKRSKRTASQEIEMLPLSIAGNSKSINSRSSQTVVFVLNKFTLAQQKYLHVQMTEQNGGRNLDLKILNRHLNRASVL